MNHMERLYVYVHRGTPLESTRVASQTSSFPRRPDFAITVWFSHFWTMTIMKGASFGRGWSIRGSFSFNSCRCTPNTHYKDAISSQSAQINRDASLQVFLCSVPPAGWMAFIRVHDKLLGWNYGEQTIIKRSQLVVTLLVQFNTN